VENVFQIVPHASNGGSGVPPVSQHHRLDAVGRHPHKGQRIPPNVFSSSSCSIS
jgi:hypothetical protein